MEKASEQPCSLKLAGIFLLEAQWLWLALSKDWWKRILLGILATISGVLVQWGGFYLRFHQRIVLPVSVHGCDFFLDLRTVASRCIDGV